MGLVIRAAVMYATIFVLLRVSGNRQFSELTAFDAALLIIISEATQQAMIGNQDFSLTAAIIVSVTLIGIDIVLSFVKQWSKTADLLMEGVPVLLMDEGKLIDRNMKKERVDISDILAAAREIHGIDRLDSIRYAILERNGTISVIPA
jgi:uncharacterized membrane protein YcaP (DUF421 family)